MLAGDALGLFDQLLDSSSSSLLDETARLSSQGVDGLTLCSKDDDMHINMEDDDAVVWKTDQDGGGGGGGGTTSDGEFIASICNWTKFLKLFFVGS